MKNDSIKVIHTFPIWLPQTQTWMYTQVKYLPKNVETYVVCDVKKNLEQFAVPNIHCQREYSLLSFYWDKVLRKLNRKPKRDFLASVAIKHDVDVIHSHFGNIGWENQEIARQVGAQHVVTYYGYDVSMLPAKNRIWISRYRELFAIANAFLCEGPHMREQLIRMGCPAKKIKVHHLGIDLDRFPYRPRKWDTKEPFRVLIAATFQEKKGIPYALQALATIDGNFPLEVTVIGDATPEKRSVREKEKILDIVENSRLKSKTRFLGFQPYFRLIDEIYKHHVFILPSVTASNGDTEGGAPVTLIEVMATGMPIVSTVHCDIPEVVQYGRDNWLVDERDVHGLVDRIMWLINSSNEWDPMLLAGRFHVEKEYAARLQGIRLAQTYREIL
jgi:colanic acid/amylovoran biosynthesis glycosyltransferase